MATDEQSFNTQLYKLLKTRGYNPIPKDTKNEKTSDPGDADVIKFTFKQGDKELGDMWATIDESNDLIIYYDNSVSSGQSSEGDYDDSLLGLKKHLKQWAMNKQLGFVLKNKDELGDDMTQRKKQKEGVNEGYHPMGKRASYNDNIPAVKIILQHNRQIEEGEQRYRNVAKIFLENQDGERFLAPTTRPGIAQVYARHIAEGGVPNDERWNHIKTICEEYSKMAGFVRATKNKQFNESAQSLVTEGINHYQSLRETLGKLRGHRGYNTYFESWTPALMEDDTDGDVINELFVQETVDPRIESVMPILSRLRKKTGETQVKEIKELEQWAEAIVEGDDQKPDMLDQFRAHLRNSKKQGNATKYFYYDQLLKNPPAAATSYENFINSWAGEEWFNKNEANIKKFADESNRRNASNGITSKFKVEYPKSLGEGDDNSEDSDSNNTLYVYDSGKVTELDTEDRLAMQRFYNKYGFHEDGLDSIPEKRGVKTFVSSTGAIVVIGRDPVALAHEVESLGESVDLNEGPIELIQKGLQFGAEKVGQAVTGADELAGAGAFVFNNRGILNFLNDHQIPLIVLATILVATSVHGTLDLFKKGKQAIIKKYHEIKGTVDPNKVKEVAKQMKDAENKINESKKIKKEGQEDLDMIKRLVK